MIQCLLSARTSREILNVQITDRLLMRILVAAVILACAILGDTASRADEPDSEAVLGQFEAAGHIASRQIERAIFETPSTGAGFWDELFEPALHTHFSPRGTPLVHLFLLEPAALHRDLFLDYRIANNVAGSTDEQELEVELEWSLTKRLGIIIEVPFLGLDPIDEPNTAGFGDLAFAGRALVVNDDTFMLATNLALSVPTGDPQRNLGRGEAVLAPSVSTWLDLGNWVSLHSQLGPEIGLESGDTSMVYGFAVTYSFQGPALFGSHRGSAHHHADHEHHDHEELHFEPGLTSLILEVSGETGLSGDDDGTTFFEVIPGVSYVPWKLGEIRFGVRFPLYRPERLDVQYLLSLVRNF